MEDYSDDRHKISSAEARSNGDGYEDIGNRTALFNLM